MQETTFRFSCGDSSLAITKETLYASNGALLQVNKYGSEKARLVDLTQPSPGLTVMGKICHSQGARGW